jgi:hypothetical protein
MSGETGMTTHDHPTLASPKIMTWTGWGLTGLFLAFMTFDTVIKLIPIAPVTDSLSALGYDPRLARTIGATELLLVVLYVLPQTTVLGAVLLTGLFGGAVATHLRLGHPLFSHVLFGVYLGLFAWGGLFLRRRRCGRSSRCNGSPSAGVPRPQDHGAFAVLRGRARGRARACSVLSTSGPPQSRQ